MVAGQTTEYWNYRVLDGRDGVPYRYLASECCVLKSGKKDATQCIKSSGSRMRRFAVQFDYRKTFENVTKEVYNCIRAPMISALRIRMFAEPLINYSVRGQSIGLKLFRK